ncbi:Vegetative incompatibility protein HET-E-1 [Pleurostoma richardsiae]|uniref:Vegetative incompatibility protein HET-E-1 n=1 Tax=Pleurostoma richardsiae TaxID=41990 RepID=A0AA38R5E3_9PEZI|nr:Vegetative incompatibility protein HET-E-1 [Pleurostoma richardsiae]
MRLLNVTTLLFEEFLGEVGKDIPPYAILSHTWGSEEVSYRDHCEQQNLTREGYTKILGRRRVAEVDGLQYIWVDTCCIDKSSSAELSEAINSMFQWYRHATVCYAYLSDVDSSEEPATADSSFVRSRWFTRGWTLQELLAPADVVFLASDWAEIGSKKSLRSTVSRVTGISERVLEQGHWEHYSAAQKMSWAAGRKTSRLEDEAYCLLGLFDINMPLLYGEGRKAFTRLQQEILRQSEDQSIFAWSYPEDCHSQLQLSGLMAPSTANFRDASKIELMEYVPDEEGGTVFEVVNRLVRIRRRVVDKVEGMRLRLVNPKYPLCQVTEVQLGSSELHDRRVPLAAAAREVETPKEGTPVRESGKDLITPVIIIEGEDNAAQGRSTIDDDGQELQGNGSSSRDSLEHPGAVGEHVLEPPSPDGDVADNSRWKWYIYEPVIIVPLQCHVSGSRLSILLTKGSIKQPRGGTLSRLHYPSIVAIPGLPGPDLSPSVSIYALIFSQPAVQPVSGSRGTDRLSSPEIRLPALLAAGYVPHAHRGARWYFDQSRATIIHNRRVGDDNSATVDDSPVIVFSHASGDDAVHPMFFIGIPRSMERWNGTRVAIVENKLEIGVFSPDPSQEVQDGQEYALFVMDLLRDRRADVALGNGRHLVVKVREGPAVSFLTVSLERLTRVTSRARRLPGGVSKIGSIRATVLGIKTSMRQYP